MVLLVPSSKKAFIFYLALEFKPHPRSCNLNGKKEKKRYFRSDLLGEKRLKNIMTI